MDRKTIRVSAIMNRYAVIRSFGAIHVSVQETEADALELAVIKSSSSEGSGGSGAPAAPQGINNQAGLLTEVDDDLLGRSSKPKAA